MKKLLLIMMLLVLALMPVIASCGGGGDSGEESGPEGVYHRWPEYFSTVKVYDSLEVTSTGTLTVTNATITDMVNVGAGEATIASGSVVVSHGLSSTPTCVQLTYNGPNSGSAVDVRYASVNSSTFTVYANTIDGGSSALTAIDSGTVSWTAFIE